VQMATELERNEKGAFRAGMSVDITTL
jgi:hypothetical protein